MGYFSVSHVLVFIKRANIFHKILTFLFISFSPFTHDQLISRNKCLLKSETIFFNQNFLFGKLQKIKGLMTLNRRNDRLMDMTPVKLFIALENSYKLTWTKIL